MLSVKQGIVPDEGQRCSARQREMADAEEWQAAIHTVKRLAACGLGPAEVLFQAIVECQWKARLHRVLSQEFPELSAEEREDCVARHLQRWKTHILPERILHQETQ